MEQQTKDETVMADKAASWIEHCEDYWDFVDQIELDANTRQLIDLEDMPS